MLIGLLAIPDHDRDVLFMSLLHIAICVKKDAEPVEVVLVAKDWPHHPVFRAVPHGKPIAKKFGALPVHMEFHRNLKSYHQPNHIGWSETPTDVI